ncbi:MAG: spinster family MFS transporter [Candidatus Acidiferrales bacterium]
MKSDRPDQDVAGVAPSDPAPSSTEPWPSPTQAWYAVFVLALGLMVTYLDRGILSLLVEPIKRDLHINDTQMSLLMGFAFICFYLIVALPIARLVDYKSRRAILGVGTAIWGVTTTLSGLARSFGELFACRVGVGVGAACSSPAAFSMLADLFPREKLARAFAFLFLGVYGGEGISLIVGGYLANFFTKLPPRSLPVVGTLHGWQLTLIAIGLPGLLVSALLMTVREPARRGRAGTGGYHVKAATQQIPVKEVVAFMWKNVGIFLPIFASMGIAAATTFGVRSWGPAFYMRSFGWTVAKYGLVQGTLALTIMPFGALAGSLFAERLAKKYDDANMRTVFIGQLLALPGMILFPLMPTGALAVAFSTWGTFFVFCTTAPMNAALQIVTPNQMRGQVTALFLFVYNVVGIGLGPTFVAMFTDFVFHSEKLLGRAITVASLIMGSLTALIMWAGVKPYGRAIVQLKAQEASSSELRVGATSSLLPEHVS